MSNSPLPSPLDSFRAVVDAAILHWSANSLCRGLDQEPACVTLDNYSELLRQILFQSYEGPASFALAAANCAPRHQLARDYLFRHAEEERDHWRWVVDDLVSIGRRRHDLSIERPPVAAQAYIAFNYYVAMKTPIARLATATVLEGIGAVHGEHYGRLLLASLRLDARQATFFLSHGTTDKAHVEELWQVIENSELSPADWLDMKHAARVAGDLYRAMYDEAASVSRDLAA